jgi:hypothetical protein
MSVVAHDQIQTSFENPEGLVHAMHSNGPLHQVKYAMCSEVESRVTARKYDHMFDQL